MYKLFYNKIINNTLLIYFRFYYNVKTYLNT